MVVYQTPTKRLTDLLSAYLDFDQKQLHLGLWRGDLEMQHVNLKNEAFSQILNTWKQKSPDSSRVSDKNSQTNTSKKPADNDSCPPSVSSFLTKDLLLSPNPSRLSHLDVKLIKGSIRHFRAVVPWKSIILGSRDSKVQIELEGVTIRLGVESCIAKAIENDEQGLYGVCKSNIKTDEDVVGYEFYSEDDVEHEKFRRWKQNAIKVAEQNLDNDQDITQATFGGRNKNDQKGDDIHTNIDDEIHSTIENVSSTFIERFVRSFASNLGWRVGKSFEAKVVDLKIVLVHDDIEVGFFNKSVSIHEFDGVHSEDENGQNEQKFGANSRYDDSGDYPDYESDLKSQKTNELDSEGDNEMGAAAAATTARTTTKTKTTQDSIIRKSIKIIGSSLFIRKANSFSYDYQQAYHDDPPSLDEHILLPTDIGIMMTLQRDGSGTSAKIEKESVTGDEVTSMNSNLGEKYSEVNHNESVETNEIKNTAGERKRRGKREKRKHVNFSESNSQIQHQSLYSESLPSDKSDYVTVDSRQRELFGNSFDRIIYDEPSNNPLNPSEDESSPQFSIQVAVSSMTFVLSTQSCLLLRSFSTKMEQLLIGKPNSRIPLLGVENATETFLDAETQESVQSEGGKQIIQQWWSYILFNVLKDIKTKKYYVQELSPQKESFIWLKHKRLKTEYISLYLRLRLQKGCVDDDIASKFDFKVSERDEERLLQLEDTLSVEQILLFRSHSRSMNVKDVLKHMAFDSIPSFLIHPLEKNPSTFDESCNQISTTFQNVTRNAHNNHRRHKSLFTMEDTVMSFDVRHRRGMTLTYDNLANTDKQIGKEIDEFDLGLHSSVGTFLQPLRQVNTISTMEEEGMNEDDFNQAFQGSITSIVTFSMKSLHLFLCERAKPKSDNLKYCDNEDEISILTTNTFDNSAERDLDYHYDLNQYSITKGANVISIFGEPHEVILSSVVHQTRVHWETKSQRNVQVVIIDGICCHSIGSSFVSAGTLRCLNTGFMESENTRSTLLSVASLPHYPFYVKDDTKDNFLRLELQTSVDDTYKQKVENQDTLRIQTLIGRIYIALACEKISRIVDFIHLTGFFTQRQLTNFRSSKFDDARKFVLEQRRCLKKQSEQTSEINLFWEQNGVELSLFTNNDCSLFYGKNSHPTSSDSTSCDVFVVINKISIRQGIFLHKTDAAYGFFKSFPRTQFINSMCTLSKIKVLASSQAILHEDIAVDILRSESKHGGVLGYNSASKVTTSVNLSPVKLLVSKQRIQNINQIVDKLNAVFGDDSNREPVLIHPRINDQSGIFLQKLRISCSFVDILVIDDQKKEIPERYLKDLFGEILSDLFRYEAKFGNEIENYETRIASHGIAVNRIQGLGFQHEKAEEIIDMSLNEYYRLLRDGTQSKDTSKAAMSNLICKVFEDSLTEVNEVDACLVSCSFGAKFYLEQLFYDWKISISLSTFTMKNATGVCLFQLRQFTNESLLENNVSAMSINMMKNETGFVFGEGGSSLSIYAHDGELESCVENSKFEQQVYFAVGQCDLLCLDEEILKVIKSISNIFTNNVSNDHVGCTETQAKTVDISTTISGEISNLNALLCTNNYDPFTKISLGCIMTDVLSNPVLYQEGKSILITATSKKIRILDLSFQGRTYEQVLISKQITSKHDESFGLKVAIPSDSRKFPTEVLITFNTTRLTLLRRFMNEFLQYILTPDFGVGRILNECYEDVENEVPEHPLWFQVHFNDCSIILPRNSESTDLIALTASRVLLANGFEESSWTYPKAQTSDEDVYADLGDSESLPEDKPFDTSLIFRMGVTATDINIFTGISQDRLKKDKLSRRLCEVRSLLDFNEVLANGKVFTLHGKEAEHPLLDELKQRIWEKVTMSPFSLNVISDFLPSYLRVLINDFDSGSNFDYDGLDLDLRMSQFYAILATWDENMQELPVLFPYSPSFIEGSVTIPTLNPDWPEYGTDSFVERMNCSSEKTFEIAVCFSEMKWHCKLDNPHFFQKAVQSSLIMDFHEDNIILHLKNLKIHVDFDVDDVMRTGIGATMFTVKDKRLSQTCFERAFEIKPTKEFDTGGFVNMTWGLDRGRAISSDELDFPFQVSILMTPDRWCLINLGMEELDTCTIDLAFIWILLEYFSGYFVDGGFGNPYFLEKEISDDIIRETFDIKVKDEESLNIDFRVWLLKPCVRIISNTFDTTTPTYVLKSAENGLFYRYKSIGLNFVSQEIYSKNLDVMRLKRPDMPRKNLRQVYTSGKGIAMLVRSLNLKIMYDHNSTSNHTDVQVNLAQNFECMKDNVGIEFPHRRVVPIQIPTPKICKPSVTPSHELGAISCEIDFMTPEYFKTAFESLYKFTGPSLEEDSDPSRSMKEADGLTAEVNDETSFSLFVDISGLKVFISDPLLGVHMPILVVNIPNLHVNCSQLRSIGPTENGISNASDLQACIDAHLWVDYYKSGPTRSWEPLMEPYQCKVLFEKSDSRGQGITISSECPLHINFSGAFFETLAFAARSFSPYISNLLGIGDEQIERNTSSQQAYSNHEKNDDVVDPELIVKEFHDRMEINHAKTPILKQCESAVFSLTNLTGDQIRYHQQQSQESAEMITYLHDRGTATLDFPATRSLVMNLKIVEIPVFKNGEQIYNDTSSGRLDSSNYIDMQIPGFSWCRSIPVDVTGKRFVGLQPKSSKLQLKITKDWRLANALSILTDVSFYEGRRQVTITSSFEMLNKTTHEIQLASHTDPTHIIKKDQRNKSPKSKLTEAPSDCNLQVINPGETVQVPLLLLESSLQQEGNNLGTFWLRPLDTDQKTFIRSLEIPDLKADEASIGFCSNPMHISHIVEESALMFRESGGNVVGSESFSSGYQLSCPIEEKEEENISPFCYCIEVKRSPLVAPFAGHDCSIVKDEQRYSSQLKRTDITIPSASEEEKIENSSNEVEISSASSEIHGPVAYSLEIHPPMVIENFLPEKARYELMHATRKKVVWSTDLMPGESVPVYTVGLDAPLLLLIHLGYCRTPVGEGALVHHGSSGFNSVVAQQNYAEDSGLNTDTVINAFTALQLSSEARAGLRIGQIHEIDRVGRRVVDNKRVRDGKKDVGARTEADGPFHHVYSIHDIATETIVVDHIGQKLNLYIDNKLGGGGQRHITVYCPYWIVNTTDHALRYRQEKSSSFVSGTMTKDSKDGSRFVDLRESRIKETSDFSTIFPGKPGALSRNNLCLDEFSRLMEKDMPLQQLASMAFMFNFRDFLSIGGYERKLSIQLADPTGGSKDCSDWSMGVSLESVGVSQTISMHCMDGRHLEIVMTTRVAPGRLSAYTKIVRLTPKYVLVNQLERPIRLWQDSSLMHPSKALDGFKNPNFSREPHHWREKSKDKFSDDVVRKYDFLFGRVSQLDYRRGTKMRPGTVADRAALYITTAGKGELVPFHLPDTKVDRELRIDLGRKWNLTASFPSDIICDHTFKLIPSVDLRILKHVDNRASARYVVQLPPRDGFDQSGLQTWDGELGLWFETIQWSRGTKIVVKGTKRGKYSINNTDIHAGDELVQIDETPVSQMSFSETMKLLKERLSEVLDVYRSARLQTVQNSKKIGMPRSKKPKFLQRFERTTNSNNVTEENVDEQSKSKETLTLVFQTLEHRMKKLRGKALGRKNVSTRMRGSSLTGNRLRLDSGHHLRTNQMDTVRATSRRQKGEEDTNVDQRKQEVIQVSLKHLNQSIFVLVHKLNLSIPYKIENRSLDYVIYFRQRGCDHHNWNELPPGDSVDYSWEEPMKSQKLTIRVGAKRFMKFTNDNPRNVKHALPFHTIDNEDQAGFGASRTLKLDEIGYVTSLPCPLSVKNQNEVGFPFLHCQITAEGKTKKLIVSDNQNCSLSDELKQLECHLQNLTRQILEEEEKQEALLTLKCFSGPGTVSENMKENEKKADVNFNQGSLPTVQEDEIVTQTNPTEPATRDTEVRTEMKDNIEKAILITADNEDEDTITSRHQVLVEIVEASGLRSPTSDASRSCNPYCTVRVIRRNKKHRTNLFALKSDNVKRTYFINQSDSPKWSGMKFVFDVSPEAELDPQGFSILVKVKDYRLMGKNGSLGMTEIRLHNLKHQKEVFGWYPLMARTGRGSDILAASAEGGRGSVKLRVQWIYSLSSLLDYYLILSQKRLDELSANCEGMKHQLENLKKDEKVEKEMMAILSKSSISIMNNKTKKMLHTSAARSTSKQSRSVLRWSRQKHPINDLSSHFERENLVRHVGSPSADRTVLNETHQHTRTSGDFEDLSFESKECVEYQSSYSQDETNCGWKSKIEDFQASSLPPTISSMKSWLQASVLLNNKSVRELYDVDRKKSPKRKSSRQYNESIIRVPYPALIAPTLAPKVVQDRKRGFLDALYASRENFERAAQRSLRAVSNPGGWLRIRPITALYLPSNGYTGMYVKLCYGSESVVSRTVPTPVNPEWSSGTDDLYEHVGNTEQAGRRKFGGNNKGTPLANKVNNFHNLVPEESFYFSDKVNENDLEINVQALKTDGSLRLSVVGVKVNSKEELGVLHIPLADAICCCTEKFDDDKNEGNGYVRWFPLTDPKWTDSVDVDVRDSHRSVLTEEKHSDVFSMNYTKCIRLAMWWEKDEQNTLHISNPSNNDNESLNYTQSYFNASLNGVSAAIIDSFKARELLSMTFTNIDVRALVTKPKTWLGFALGNVQIDHHHEDALEPVVLGPSPVVHPQPTIQFLAERDNIKSKSNIDSFRHIAIQLEELDLRIEDHWVFDLWDMYAHLQKKLHAMRKSITRSTAGKPAEQVDKHNFGGGVSETIFYPQHSSEIIGAINESQREKQDLEAEDKVVKKIYIDELMLGSVKLNISYSKSLRNKSRVPVHYHGKKRVSITDHRRAEIFRLWSELGHGEDWTARNSGQTRSFPELVSTIFPPISAAPLRVSGKALNNVFETWSELLVTLKNFYSREMIYQFYKIIGSLDLPGNPLIIMSSMIKGARDFVRIPLQEFLRRPKDQSGLGIVVASRLGVGFAKGTLSFFSHFFSGIFGFVSDLSESLGSGVATLSLDEYFKRWHAEQAASQARHRNLAGRRGLKTHVVIGSAITQPMKKIVVGVYFAASGLIVEPYVGARNEGFNGLARGVLIGGLGIVTKPIVGIFDAFAHFSGSIKDVARSINYFDKKFKPLSRRRYPYIFGCSNILQPYNAIDARSASLLRLFPMDCEEKSERDELLVMSEMLLLYPGEATYIVVTTRRIVLFEVQIHGRAPPSRIWQNEFSDDVKIISCVENFRHSGYVLRIQRLESGNLMESDQASDALVERSASQASTNKNAHKSEGKNLKTIYEQAGALLPTIALTSKPDYRNPAYVEVLGEFAHSRELTRVHNAICCLSKQFDSVIHNSKNNVEGCTSFKNMYFVDESISGNGIQENYDKFHNKLFQHLEQMPWIHFGDLNYSSGTEDIRRAWKFSDELNVSKRKGGPSWVVKSRARSSFTPMAFPQLPSRFRLKQYPVVSELKDKLQKGEMSQNEVEIELSKLIFNEDEMFTSAHEFHSMKNREADSFMIEELDNDNDLNDSRSIESDNSSFVRIPVESNIENTGIESVSSVQEEDHDIEVDIEVKDPEPDSKPTISNSAEQRLAHVEQMLQTLMVQISEQNSAKQTSQTTPIRAPPLRFTTATSMISALSNSDNIFDGGAMKQGDARDREQLLKEIEDLKRQLAYAQQNPPNYINALNETASTSTGVKRRKKKRKRKLIKKPWK